MTISALSASAVTAITQSQGQSTKTPVSNSSYQRQDAPILQVKSEDASITRLRTAAENYLKTLNVINQISKSTGESEAKEIFDAALKIDANGEDGNDSLNEARDALGLLVIEGTSGNDFISATGNIRIEGGSGDDIIHAYGQSQIDGGAGRNTLHAHGQSQIEGGEDQDFIHTYGQSEINAGAGNDYIGVVGQSIINAGSGNDHITVYGQATVDAGSGDDSISINGSGTTLQFGQGSGQDKIYLNGDINIEIGTEFSIDDLQFSKFGRGAQISFAGSDDKLHISIIGDNRTATLKFAGGQSLDISLTVNLEEESQFRIDPKYIQRIGTPQSSGTVDKTV